MKAQLQLASSALALAGLVVGVAAHATNLAELPLKAAVLAKPNVIFGLDDSGSTDWEVMLDTTEGVLWLNTSTTPPTSWTAAGLPIRDTGSGTTGFKYAYLFPVGIAPAAASSTAPTGPGAQLGTVNCSGHTYTAVVGGQNYGYCGTTATNNGWGMAAPPIPQLAALRSAAFNANYYNPAVTYQPWAPAYHDGAMRSYGNATPSAARIGPQHAASGTLDLTQTVAANTAAGRIFFAHAGHRLPVGSRVCTTTTANVPCTTWGAATTAETVMTDRRLVAVPYYPATYWQREACTADDTSTTSSCVTAPGGGTLRRYEIRSGNTFPSGRSYADEMQNFANWFQYYRKRSLMLAAAAGKVMENLTGMRLGVVPFNNRLAVTMYDADATNPANNRYAAAGRFYTTWANSGTPTRETLAYIGNQFHTNTSVIQYACQRNAAFIVTDGFANASSPAVVPPTYNQATWGSGWPYQVTSANSQADIALSYFTTRLRGTAFPAGRVPLGTQTGNNPDANPDLHMNTYALMLGIKGTIWPDVTDAWSTTFTWPVVTASGDRGAIDDLWHATINGRGQMYLASTPEETAISIQAGLNDILSQDGAQGGVAVSAVNLDRSDSQAYLGVYNPRGWSGDLTANPIATDTAVISPTPNWSAATLLGARDWTSRVIVTSNGGSGIDFSAANVGSVVNPDSASFSDAAVVDYLRGSRAGEGGSFRQRFSLIGAVINAEPVLARDEGMVYLASGEGMLHAIDTATGAEQWAYVPQEMWSSIGQSVQRGWVFKTQLDATPAYARLSTGSKLLVGGLGAAGRSYYALDVSSPRNLTTAQAAAQFRWTFPAPADTANRALMGYTVGKPVIARHATLGNIVLVTSGYDNGVAIGDARGRLWVLNATTGAVLRTFRTSAGTVAPGQEAGLAHVSAFREDSGYTRYVYGGDLRGNLWKFDLDRNDPGEMDAELLASLRDSFGNAQPITAAPELTTVYNRRVVLVGTGRVLDLNDFGSTARQSFYAIADGATLANARTALVAQTYTRATDTITANPVNWATDRGWYFDLPVGEQANTDPIVTYGAVAFVTNVNGSSDCAQSSYMYLIDVGTGSRVVNSTFVSEAISTSATSSRVITLRVVDGRIIGTTHRSDNTVYQRELPLGQIINPSKNAWREVRR